MRTLSSMLALSLVAGLAAAAPALASEGGEGFPITLSAPTPRDQLGQALAQLRAHDLAGAAARIEAVQNELISDSLAERLPAQMSPTALRDAVPVLDEARQALARGDAGAAEQAVSRARAMI